MVRITATDYCQMMQKKKTDGTGRAGLDTARDG